MLMFIILGKGSLQNKHWHAHANLLACAQNICAYARVHALAPNGLFKLD